MSPVLSIDATFYLESLVTDHHSQYLKVFQDKNLTPKHHFMLHYGEAIRRCGPLRHLWCMRFESKHQIAKKVGDLSNNFKSIAITVATQYTLSTFCSWALNEIFPKTIIGKTIDGNKVSSIRYRGVLLKPGCVIRYGSCSDVPGLAMVDSITCDGSVFMLKCKKLAVDDYCEHYCAFPIDRSDICCEILLSEVKCTEPLFVHFNHVGKEFVYLPSLFTSSFNSTDLY